MLQWLMARLRSSGTATLAREQELEPTWKVFSCWEQGGFDPEVGWPRQVARTGRSAAAIEWDEGNAAAGAAGREQRGGGGVAVRWTSTQALRWRMTLADLARQTRAR